MTGFANLPNELIVEVWRWVMDPKSVENFALTSKRVYALGRGFVREHNVLKLKFSSIPHDGFGTDSGPAETLRTLLQNCRAALYVRELMSNDWRIMRKGSDDSVQIDHSPFPNHTTELSRQLIKGSPLILEDEIEPWLDTIEAGSEGACFFLLLMMLPKLQSLTMDRVFLVEPLLFNSVKRFTESGPTEVLSRLTEVRLLAGDNMTEFREFDWVFTFAKLPSVKAIKAWDIGPEYECLDYNNHNDDCIGNCYGPEENYNCNHTVCHKRRPILLPKTSSVTHLTFVKCFINTRKLVRVFESLQALESFEWDNKWETTRGFTRPKGMEIVDALLDHAKYTLRRLRIRACGWVTRLAEFKVMKELDIGYDLLLDHRVRGDPVDFLPPSIEIVKLSRTYTYTHSVVRRDVREMTTEKAKHFPNLKEVTINIRQIDEELKGYIEEALNPGTVSYLKQQCEDVGVHLSVMVYPRFAFD